MNIIGIITCVALPAFACGISVATWVIRAPFMECDCCGDLCGSGVFRCTGCDHASFQAIVEHAVGEERLAPAPSRRMVH